jgi:hypothetical protein
VGWLSYVIAFGMVLGAAALLGWALLRQARGRDGCGSGCCTCSFLGSGRDGAGKRTCPSKDEQAPKAGDAP